MKIMDKQHYEEQPEQGAAYLQEGGEKKIYIASKTRHADKWIKLRNEGVNIISTWIDEAGVGQSPDMADLCRRCIKESFYCDAMIVYSEEGDYLKGAFIEMGVALSCPLKPIYLVGPVLPHGSAFTHSNHVFIVKSVEEAIQAISQLSIPSPQPPAPDVQEAVRLKVLKEIKFIFELHSDFSTRFNGYYSLCDMINKLESKSQQP